MPIFQNIKCVIFNLMKNTKQNTSGAIFFSLPRIITVMIVVSAHTPVAVNADPKMGIAALGQPAWSPSKDVLPYIQVDAPQGGHITYGELGTFNSLHPYIVQGKAAWGVQAYVYESLMKRSLDEPFSLYGLLAETIDINSAKSYVEFQLRSEAKFSDGIPVTPKDVLWSFETLKKSGHPKFSNYYKPVIKAEKIGKLGIRFTFDTTLTELPLLLGLMPILPQHDWENQSFSKTTLRKLTGSGPYIIQDVQLGRSLMLARNPDYWGHSLPVNQGVNNFDNITYEYFRDDAALFEAFKTGHISVFRENNVMRWKNSYNFPAAQKKKVFREEIPHQRPSGMYGFVFNTRKDLFQDIRVRKALALALDFTWINKTLFGGEYQHIRSYFDNSPLASPKGAAQGLERELLLPFQAELPEQTIEAGWSSPKGAGDGNNRENLRSASKMLEKSGWHIRNNHLTGQNGQVFSFEILVHTSEDERVASIFSHMLRLLGIEMRVRLLDDSSYQEKLKSFDFDMIIHKWWLSLSPGTEQRIYWSGEVANTPGSRNYPGIHSNAVDHLIDVMTTTHDEAVYTNSVRALDRVLSSGVYVIPLWFSKYDRLARWDGYHKPEHPKLYGYNPDVWWYDK